MSGISGVRRNTTIHPVWSVDRQEWVPLAELTDGEALQGLDGLAVDLSVTLSRLTQPVYSIEVHGEHVYQVGELGLVVHNACSSTSGNNAAAALGHLLGKEDGRKQIQKHLRLDCCQEQMARCQRGVGS